MVATQPIPRPTRLTEPFWAGCKRHKLLVQRCVACSAFRFYPTAACPFCADERSEWILMSGRGRVYSWIVMNRAIDPIWANQVPFVSAVVELEEQAGLLVPGILRDIDPHAVQPGARVEVIFEDVTDEISLPRWRPLPEV